MSSDHFGGPSASAPSSQRPVNLPPPRDIISAARARQHGSCPHHHHHGDHIRPSDPRSSTSASTSNPRYQLHQPLVSSLSTRPAYSSSSRSPSSSFIPTQSASSFSHWATQDPFDFVPRPRFRRSVFASPWSLSNSRPSERRANGPPPFAPSPPTSRAGARQFAPPRPITLDNNSDSLAASRTSTTASDSGSEPPAPDNMPPAPRQTRKRRATNDVLSSSPPESPAQSTRSSKRRAAPQRASTSSADKPPEASSSRRPAAAAATRTAPPRRANATKREPAEEPIVFESSDVEEESEYKVIDLVDKDEVPEEAPEPKPEPPKEDNTVKLGAFQCVICMDDVTDLTVTHCGMFICPLPEPNFRKEIGITN